MDRKPEEFRKRLLATFRMEADEHIGALSRDLVELERNPQEDRPAALERMFREAHSLKGAARAVNVSDIESVCQALEDLFASWQRRETLPSAPLFDLLHRTLSFLEDILSSLDHAQPTERTANQSPTALAASLIQHLGNAKGSSNAQPSAPRETQPAEPSRIAGEGKAPPLETVRMSAARLNGLLLEVEELLAAKLATRQHAADAREMAGTMARWKKVRTQMRPYLRRLRQTPQATDAGPGWDGANSMRPAEIRRLLELLEQDEAIFASLEGRMAAFAKSSERDYRSVERMLSQLLDSMKTAVMLPASALLESFPKLARDLAHDQRKQVDLLVHGAEIEVDRRMLEAVKDPLLHLVRNCIDHGIELSAEREQAGKPSRGSVRIALQRKGADKVEFVVADDGRGIDANRVRAAAIRLGMYSPEAVRAMDDQAARSLIFNSGVSTSPIITDISGRGLGLAIVREKVERLGGSVSVETEATVGTTFRILLPVTRASFRGVVVRVDERLFVLPTAQVERVLRIRPEEVKTVENCDTVSVRGSSMALVHLRDALELPVPRSAGPSDGIRQAVVLGSGTNRIAFSVDEILGEQEVISKSLGRQLARVRNVAGVTVFGSGTVVPILEGPDLLQAATRVFARTRPTPLSRAADEPQRNKTVLVAEDSITSRTLLRNILESAGYQVQTAVDGAEAFATLKAAPFDVVVSDVDMPRMSGFALTAKIRSDPALSELPVILVTALGSPEDRERGIEAGANAYIVKSSFDQNNLLELLRRLT